MTKPHPTVHSDSGIMGGTPVFAGTRVPFQPLLDYLEAGDPLSAFLEDFPTVSREQAIAALEQAKDALLRRGPFKTAARVRASRPTRRAPRPRHRRTCSKGDRSASGDKNA